MNLFMYIIWNNAYAHKDAILNDLERSFSIIKVMEILWRKDYFNENLNRFYGQKLPKNSFKEKACGYGPFTLVVIEDKEPLYENRLTTRGEQELVNIHTFDKKMLYREWTRLPSGSNCVHGTNSPEETEHDMTLLLGTSPEDFYNRVNDFPDSLSQDIIGCDGWDSIEQMFYVLNRTCKYVVLRNFEGFPENYNLEGHDDIDLLVEDYEEVKRLLKAREKFHRKYRVQCVCTVAGKEVQFDFRYLGDEYYDKKWQQDILDKRQLNNNIYIPDDENYKYSLLYHALVHKRGVASDYEKKLKNLFGNSISFKEVIKEYLKIYNYDFTEPSDISVFYNESVTDKKMTCKRRIRILFRKIRWKLLNDRS